MNGHVIVVADADTTDDSKIARQKEEYEIILSEFPIGWNYHIVIAIPRIESWISNDINLDNPREIDLSLIDWDQRIEEIDELKKFVIFFFKKNYNEI